MKKDLKDPQFRRQEIDKAIKAAQESYRKRPPEEAREPVLKLQDRFDKAGVDRLELYYNAESSLPTDPFWLDEIVAILLRKVALDSGELSYLLRKAMISPGQLELWVRIFRDARMLPDQSLYQTAREQCAHVYLSYFPNPQTSRWADTVRQGDAREIFTKSLEEAAAAILKTSRDDAEARALLVSATEYFPERSEFIKRLADQIVRTDAYDRKDLALVLRAMIEVPGIPRYGVWAAKGLMKTPGHQEEGMEMLRKLARDHERDNTVAEEYINALKEMEVVLPDDVKALTAFVRKNPEDVRALELLADFHAAGMNLGSEALHLYRRAAAKSPKRGVYLRLIGKESASRNDWAEVMEVFKEVLASGHETEEVIMPMATACAEFQRGDHEAVNVYAKAIGLGSRKVEVHSLYCRHLYLTARDEPASVAQFMQSAAICPECGWAQLGVVAHFLNTGDFERTLDGAMALLEKNPRDVEGVKLAARALAGDYSRKQVAKLSKLPPELLRSILEEAYKLAPEAGLIAIGLARRRLADGVENEETARLLGDCCRKNPDAFDLRIVQADMLWNLKQFDNATESYRDLVERMLSGGNPQLSRVITPAIRARMLQRLSERLLMPPGPGPEHFEVLIEAAMQPDAGTETMLSIARSIAGAQFDHPRKLALLKKAHTYAPSDRKIERAITITQAIQGNPRPALELAIKALAQGNASDETIALLRAAQASASKETVPGRLLDELTAASANSSLTPSAILPAVELVLTVRDVRDRDMPVLERLSRAFPKNVPVKRHYAKLLEASGKSQKAAEIYNSLLDESPEDNDLLLEKARSDARIGRHTADGLAAAQRAMELQPDDAELILHYAAIQIAQAEYREAVAYLNKLVDTQPEFHSRVIAVIEGSRAARTERMELNLLLARVHVKLRHADKALAILARLQANYQECFGELMACYDDVIAIDSENPRAYIERAILKRISGHLDEAIEDLEKARTLVPDNVNVLSEYADVLQQKIQSSDSVPAMLILRCGEIQRQLGDDHAAFEMAEVILERDPENQAALRLTAELQLSAIALQSCWRTVKKLKDRSGALDLLQELSRAFAEDGHHLMAAEVLTDAIEVAGPQRGLLEQLRLLYQDQAKSSQGAAARQKILGSLSSRAQGRYELREELGSGAMGIVYKAYDRELDELVVLKILPENFAQDPDALARFRNEAKAARKLAHPNIVRIHDIGEEGGRKHLSMEFVAGGDLAQYLKKNGGRLPVHEAVRVTKEICNALAHAHEEGVLHRDIKTANILMTSSGRVKLSDFGIASLYEAGSFSADSTRGGATIMGTPLYMSPEQFDAASLTPASDLYSVGILLYELLSGAPPFTRGSLSYHHQFTQPTRIAEAPGTLWSIIAMLLDKEPHERFQEAREVISVLDNFMRKENVKGPEDTQELK
ncbi:protein kinase [Candidatus Sumerlaeota bacterium]|nr:protein kinase [Candidatus Sumerlaeota bacterium]